MKYDSDTAKVDRWSGMSKEDIERGYATVPQESFPKDSQLEGTKTPIKQDKPD
jgi:hypothetical protein